MILYAEGDVYDEVNECWLLELIDTSEEFTITWTSNEHIHTYGAIPNGKDETNHWKECTDPACPDKAHSKIEVEAHKDNTADYKCDICGYELPVPEYIVSYNENGGSGTMVGDVIEKGGTFTLEACTYTAPEGKRFKAWAIGSVNGEQKQPNEQIIITAETYIYAIWEDITYTVTFNANGGAGSMLDETEQLGGYVLPECTFTEPTGKQFKCWAEGILLYRGRDQRERPHKQADNLYPLLASRGREPKDLSTCIGRYCSSRYRGALPWWCYRLRLQDDKQRTKQL